jgi:hypothetical protein
MDKRANDISNNQKEIRMAAQVEFREDQETKRMILEAYFLKFNQQTLIGSKEYGFREQILPDALKDTDMKKVPLKYNHQDGYLALASTKNGSLKLTVDKIGLRGEAELLDIQSHKDIYEMVRSGLITECSFAFTIPMDGTGSEWNFDEEGVPPLRTIKKIDRLFDVSIVDLPAYENTEVYARSFEKFEDTRKALEEARAKNEESVRRINMKIKLGGIK